METMVKIENSKAGKKLLAYLKSLEYVKVIGEADNFIALTDLQKKIKAAEKSKSLTLQEAKTRSAEWKTKYKSLSRKAL